MTDEQFQEDLQTLHEAINQQGDRVAALVLSAFDAVFNADADLAAKVITDDDKVDAVDIEIERNAIELVKKGLKSDRCIRMVLTIVKVNNELERIADLAADIAEQVVLVAHLNEPLPATTRMMVNSVIGMIRDANRSMRNLDSKIARTVLSSDDLVEQFKTTILREAQQHFAQSDYSVDFVLAMWRIASAANRIAAHATNICEQVIYVESGQIVRHSAEGWSEPRQA